MSTQLPPVESSLPTRTPSLRTAYLVVALGFLAIVFEGYDLIVFGSAVPALLKYEDWGLTPAQVGAIGSYALFGMFVGAPLSGWLTDRFGRRKLFIGLVTFFSLMMILVALAPTPQLLGLFRFLAGVGFGGIPPTAIALVIEFAPAKRKAFFNAVMLTGFPVGGILAALMSIFFLSSIGWRGLFAFGALPLITLVPLAIWLLPESPRFHRSSITQQADGKPAAKPLRDILRGRLGIATALFAVASFASFLLVFGLNTWLPQLMTGAGYSLGSGLQLLLVLNIGGVVGALVGSWLADRIGIRKVVTVLFLLAGIMLGLLAIPGAASTVTMLLIFIAGACVVGGQAVLWGYVATHYGHQSRATALGVSSGIGRLGAATGPLIGGFLVAAGIGLSGNVLVFAVAAVITAVACVLVPHLRTATGDTDTIDPDITEIETQSVIGELELHAPDGPPPTSRV